MKKEKINAEKGVFYPVEEKIIMAPSVGVNDPQCAKP